MSITPLLMADEDADLGVALTASARLHTNG
jgi:hypothetical protein